MIKILKEPTDQTNGTFLVGHIETTYEELVNKFGKPTFTDDDPREKVNAEWVLEIDGKIATIYNWKTGRVPMGNYKWHVGGHDSSVVDLLYKDNFVVEID